MPSSAHHRRGFVPFTLGPLCLLGVCPPDLARAQCGPTWVALPELGVNGTVNTLYSDPAFAGARVLVGGEFTSPHTAIASLEWSGGATPTIGPVGAGLGTIGLSPQVIGIARFGGASTPGSPESTIYVTGLLNARQDGVARSFNFARLDGPPDPSGLSTFRAFGPSSGPGAWMGDIAVHTLGREGIPRLLTTGGGLFPCSYAIEWTGEAWECPGLGLDSVFSDHAMFDDGAGSSVFCTGSLSVIGATLQQGLGIARWDGSTWHTVGGGLSGAGHACAVYDDGSGPALYVGGVFTRAGSAPNTRNIARWNGTTWSSVGISSQAQAPGVVTAMAVFDDNSGLGPVLYVAGSFSQIGGVPALGLARWDGSAWSAAPVGGVTGSVSHMEILDLDADGPARPRLVVAGTFTSAGGRSASNLAVLLPAPPSIDFDGDLGITVDDLIAYIGSFADGQPGADLDDGSGSGTHDGGVTIDDLLYFLDRFAAGC